jgi:protein gp37
MSDTTMAFQELVIDISKNGLLDKIVLTPDGTLLDGRHRLRACQTAGVTPLFRSRPDGVADEEYIISANQHRRHETPGQRAITAARINKYFTGATASRRGGRPKGQNNPQSEKPVQPSAQVSPDRRKATAMAGAVLGVSKESVRQAERLEEAAPDLADAVRRGEMNLKSAYLEHRRRQGDRPRKRAADPQPTKAHAQESHSCPSHPPGLERNSQPVWANWAWNPITGGEPSDSCTLQSPHPHSHPGGLPVQLHQERLSAPIDLPQPDSNDRRDRRISVCPKGDLFGPQVPDEWINTVLEVCTSAPWWQYIFLTRHPSRYSLVGLPEFAWAGVSLHRQDDLAAAEEIMSNLEAPAIKWICLEPLLEPLHFEDLSMFDALVIGPQTGIDHRPTVPHFEWVASLVSQARRGGCAVYCKPALLGVTNPQNPGMVLPQEGPLDRPQPAHKTSVRGKLAAVEKGPH